ncbi:MAG TPA: AI-2E family transporter [Hanamia sp.]|nr:AI-2E family transporter [Hanamia sp.]
MNPFNNHLRQIILLGIIILVGILIVNHFFIFLPGVLGSITLYILSKKSYFNLVEKRKWKKSWTALLYILGYTIIICLPVYLAVVMLVPKLIVLFNNPVPLVVAVKGFSQKIQEATGIELFNGDNVQLAFKNLAGRVPMLLTSTANFITNLILMFFVLYYMLFHGRKMENYINDFIPLKNKNREMLSAETDLMIRANAIGIPLLAIIQGVVGMLGYFIFGIKEFGVWGFLTGVASLIPIIGTGIIWVPLTIYLLVSGHTWQGVGLGIYSLAILTNVDYVARITLLRKIGDVHPLITIFGVIVGLSLFGFLGLVFGPLLISYFILLIKIYRNEFNSIPITPIHHEEEPKHKIKDLD